VVRDALAARVNDPHDDTRAEAIVALAQRRDKRAFPAVLAELTSGCEGRLVLQAAKLLADDRLLAPLIDLRDWWELDRELLEEAIRWCDPALRAADETAAAGVVDAVQHAFPAAMPTSRLLRAFSERSAVSEERELVIEWAGANGVIAPAAGGWRAFSPAQATTTPYTQCSPTSQPTTTTPRAANDTQIGRGTLPPIRASTGACVRPAVARGDCCFLGVIGKLRAWRQRR